MKTRQSLFGLIPSRSLWVGLMVGMATILTGAAAQTPFSKLVVFGDSLSDTHRYFEATGEPSAPYHQGRFCNGPLWIEYFAERLRMPLLPECNYAFAGATTGRDNENDDDFPVPMDFPGLLDQVDTFLAESGASGADPDALYVLWAGAVDFVLLAENGDDPAAAIAEGVGNLVSAVQGLAGAGARHILVVNVPDLGLIPLATLSGQGEQLSLLVMIYNQALEQVLDQLGQAGISTIRVAADSTLQSMVREPEAYGFTNVTDPYLFVGGDPDAFVFLDLLHPTTAAHKVLADAAIHSLLVFYAPLPESQELFSPVQSLNGRVEASTHP